MMVAIEMTENEAGRFYELTCVGSTMTIGVCRYFVTTCAHNSAASLRNNRGGRVFHGADAFGKAASAYKSGKAKAMFDAVRDAEALRAAK